MADDFCSECNPNDQINGKIYTDKKHAILVYGNIFSLYSWECCTFQLFLDFQQIESYADPKIKIYLNKKNKNILHLWMCIHKRYLGENVY